MVFKNNPGFVFHDSRGFEAGGVSEFEKVKEFIASRSKEKKITNQLHAIWYCIPMDEAARSFTAAENKFFSQCDTGSIPVIVLFTKFDALYDVEYAKLKKEGRSRKDAKELAPKQAEESFPNGPQLKFLKDVRWPPKCYVCLSNMEKDDADCKTLIERTAGALDNEVLQQLFVSTQQTNLEICMKYAVERTLSEHFDSAKTTTSEGYERIIGILGAWFPHIWYVCRFSFEQQQADPSRFPPFAYVSVSILVRATATLIQVVAHRSQYVSVSILVRATATLIQVVAHHSQEEVSVSIFVQATAMLIQVVAHRSQGPLSRLYTVIRRLTDSTETRRDA
ncbi:uncharacterized protein HD556DRAFT_1462284 [Suillus plorans]|uniref:G domain-containing protein n=1 Tax=Suillus plorans TaxID=116603 RepID=A0A9P7DMR1_9AGAM|nr:uncharacterized protein HD556DRAFT_1462284 [Suillus plorans]KAG1798595.1 hypothetical protein HD556DRAFT_1462284 [Suillus plorans]